MKDIVEIEDGTRVCDSFARTNIDSAQAPVCGIEASLYHWLNSVWLR